MDKKNLFYSGRASERSRSKSRKSPSRDRKDVSRSMHKSKSREIDCSRPKSKDRLVLDIYDSMILLP